MNAFTLTPALLTLDGEGAIPGYVREGVLWNGWECPVFDLGTLRANRATLADMLPDLTWDDDDVPHLVETYEDGGTEDAISVVTIDGRDYIDIGSWGYVWSVAEEG